MCAFIVKQGRNEIFMFKKNNESNENKDNNKNKNNNRNTNIEDSIHVEELLGGEETTKYGEFISSYFAWLGLNKQKTRAEELNEITKRKNN